MNKKWMRMLSIFLIGAVSVLSLQGCSPQVPDEPEPPEVPEDDEEVPDQLMAPGTYTGSGQGFYLAEDVEVSVTVDEDSILDIEVSFDNGETTPILQSVVDKMVPRMLDHQSVDVDVIAGATVSSVAVRLAVTEALTKAIEAAGSDAAAISRFRVVPERVTDQVETIETGVLVVGMGGSGTAAAMRAVETMYADDPANVNVLAIDKAGKYGGTSALTTGVMAVNPTRFQEEHNEGADYMDKEAIRTAWIDYTEGDLKVDVLDLMLDYSGEALDWLMYDHEFQFSTPRSGFTPADVYDCWYDYLPNYTGANKSYIGEYYDALYDRFEEMGGSYMLETEAYELIYDEANHAVKGVKARYYDGTEYEIYADAVILATGGFAGSSDMMTKYLSDTYYPLPGRWQMFGSSQNDGKMIEAAIDQGAGTYNIGMPPIVHLAGTPRFLTQFEKYPVEGVESRWYGRPAVWSPGDIPLNMVINPRSMTVNTEGTRFANEAAIAFDSWKEGPTFYSIWSDNQIQRLKEEGFEFRDMGISTGFLGHGSAIPVDTPLPNIEDVLEAGIAARFIFKADTIEELAEMINMDPETLANTLATYNEYCENGEDPDFGKSGPQLEKLEEGPFYAIIGAPYAYSTSGGLDIDSNFNVLRADGSTPIQGLYAVGTDSMGVLFTEKKAYVTFGAAAQGWAYTSGYLCGEIAVNHILSR